jgi:hypothetical protein
MSMRARDDLGQSISDIGDGLVGIEGSVARRVDHEAFLFESETGASMLRVRRPELQTLRLGASPQDGN